MERNEPCNTKYIRIGQFGASYLGITQQDFYPTAANKYFQSQTKLSTTKLKEGLFITPNVHQT